MPIAACITQNRCDGLSELERFSFDVVAKKLNSHTIKMRETMDNFITDERAGQAEAQSQQGRDRLSTFEGFLTQAWQKYIVSIVDDTVSPLRQEVHCLAEEVSDPCWRIIAVETTPLPKYSRTIVHKTLIATKYHPATALWNTKHISFFTARADT